MVLCRKTQNSGRKPLPPLFSLLICFKKSTNFRLCAADPSLLADRLAAATAAQLLGQGFA
jgi:hypothetical protein